MKVGETICWAETCQERFDKTTDERGRQHKLTQTVRYEGRFSETILRTDRNGRPDKALIHVISLQASSSTDGPMKTPSISGKTILLCRDRGDGRIHEFISFDGWYLERNDHQPIGHQESDCLHRAVENLTDPDSQGEITQIPETVTIGDQWPFDPK